MKKILPALSWGMLIIGGLLILTGVGWGIWSRLDAPPPAVISDAGAVVMAETAPLKPSPTPTVETTPLPTVAAASPSGGEGPTPELLPQWTLTPPTPAPSPTVQPSPTPKPTSLPAAERPPTRIVAPAIELDAPIEAMGWEMVDHDGTMISEWIVPENAAGWHLNSAFPGNGENVVLSGHHNIKGKVFRYVIDLHIGDELTLYVEDVPYIYTITDKYLLQEHRMPTYIRKQNAKWILPTGDERLTLVTCWPYEWPGNSHRVIVVARPPGYVDPRSTDIK